MDTGTFLAIGALVVSIGSFITDRLSKRRSGDQGDRALDLQEDDLSTRQVMNANTALQAEVGRLGGRVEALEAKQVTTEKRAAQAELKAAECEEREKSTKRQFKAEIDKLMTLLIRNGITP